MFYGWKFKPDLQNHLAYPVKRSYGRIIDGGTMELRYRRPSYLRVLDCRVAVRWKKDILPLGLGLKETNSHHCFD